MEHVKVMGGSINVKATILGVLILLAVLPTVASAAVNYKPCKAARIEFGSLDSQVGVSWVDETKPNPEGLSNEGVRGLAVDGSGNIYIGDIVNGKVKKFSSSGKLLAATAGVLENIQLFDIDKQGNTIVYNSSFGSHITKFSTEGKRIWSYSRAEIMPRSALSKIGKELNAEVSDFGWLTAMSDGRILLELTGWDLNTRKPRSVGLVLSSDGKMIKALPAFGRECGGLLLWRKSTTEKESLASVEAMWYNTDGVLVKQVQLDSEAEIKTHYAGVRFGVATVFCDGQGGVITVSYAKSPSPVRISSKAIIGTDVLLNRYDADGKFVAHLRLPASPVSKGIASNIAIAPNGDIYHLKFDKTGVDVMRYEPKK
ncbi:MAG TPA: hypothetical protein VMX94_10530 [Armatimonadota bacterium]|nr:hypothetical protein [Armatimonadota bacterium]